MNNKRARTDEPMQVSPMVQWPPPSVLYHHVAPYLDDSSFWDHWHFAQTNRALWHYYREHDPCMQAMIRYIFDPYARAHEPKDTRRRNIIATGILRCVNWMWEREPPGLLKEHIAAEYMERAAAKGALDVIRKYSPFLSQERRVKFFGTLIRDMTRAGQDGAACQLYTQREHVLPGWPLENVDTGILFLHASSYANRVPNFFTLMYKNSLPLMKEPEGQREISLFTTSLMAVAGVDAYLCDEAFSYIWQNAPSEWQARAGYDIFYESCSAIIREGPDARPTWAIIISRLPYIGSRYIKSPAMGIIVEKGKTTGVRWSFASPGHGKPAFDLRCDVVDMNLINKELSCRITFQTTGPQRLLMQLVFTLSLSQSPFYLRRDGQGFTTEMTESEK